jgi:transketolase
MTSKIIPIDVRKIILQQSKRANVGHIGSALSVVEILSAVYSGALKINDFSDPDRDRFVLSKVLTWIPHICLVWPSHNKGASLF